MTKKLVQSVHARRSPARLADEDLAAVSGAKKGGVPAWMYGSPITNQQTNVSGPIVQIAVGNSGPVSQLALVQQGNVASF